MAKRQREAEKRDKAARKREKRENRQAQAPVTAESSNVSDDETRVLRIFSRYLMSAGKMLCLSGPELVSHRESLDKLVDAGLLVPESYKGAYSLTNSGFEAMKRVSDEQEIH